MRSFWFIVVQSTSLLMAQAVLPFCDNALDLGTEATILSSMENVPNIYDTLVDDALEFGFGLTPTDAGIISRGTNQTHSTFLDHDVSVEHFSQVEYPFVAQNFGRDTLPRREFMSALQFPNNAHIHSWWFRQGVVYTVSDHSNIVFHAKCLTEPRRLLLRTVSTSLGPIAPHPVFDNISVSFWLAEELPLEFTLFDNTGHVVWRGEFPPHSSGSHTMTLPFDVSKTVSGVYYLRFNAGNTTLTSPCIIVR